ncbi:hypothetical protein X975_18262, partial [Stegodyphus mimosarum]
MKKSLTRHILQEHGIQVPSCMKWCGLCNTLLVNKVSAHACFRSIPPVTASGASFRWKCSRCPFSCPSKKGLVNHMAFHQRAERNSAAHNIHLPEPVAIRQRRRRLTPLDSSTSAAASSSYVPGPSASASSPVPASPSSAPDVVPSSVAPAPVLSTPAVPPPLPAPVTQCMSPAPPACSPSSPQSPLVTPSPPVLDAPVFSDDAADIPVSSVPSDDYSCLLPADESISLDPPLLLHRDSLQCFSSGPIDDSSWNLFESCLLNIIQSAAEIARLPPPSSSSPAGAPRPVNLQNPRVIQGLYRRNRRRAMRLLTTD